VFFGSLFPICSRFVPSLLAIPGLLLVLGRAYSDLLAIQE
jgi:hypothetical protein